MSLHLASIHVYPVKSLGGYAVSEARLTDRGLEHDRRWMLVDDNGRFISQREVPSMACLHVTPAATGLRVTDVRDGGWLQLPSSLPAGPVLMARVWDDTVPVLTAPSSFGHWFSERLGRPCRLVHMPTTSHRPTDARYATATTSLSDAFPYLIVSQASLDDLNARIAPADRVPMDRFRPNLVIAGGTPFQEDGWREIAVGPCTFWPVKPCARCVITTTDQETGVRGKEPLSTLARYRGRAQDGGLKVDFGMNAIAIGAGMVRVGDRVRPMA